MVCIVNTERLNANVFAAPLIEKDELTRTCTCALRRLFSLLSQLCFAELMYCCQVEVWKWKWKYLCTQYSTREPYTVQCSRGATCVCVQRPVQRRAQVRAAAQRAALRRQDRGPHAARLRARPLARRCASPPPELGALLCGAAFCESLAERCTLHLQPH